MAASDGACSGEAELPEVVGEVSAGADRLFPAVGARARESSLSVSRFNKWLVSELKRETGRSMRGEQAELRSQRQQHDETHRQWGASLSTAAREQLGRDRQQCELKRRSNLQKGAAVRAEAEAQRKEASRLRAEWAEHGRKLAEAHAHARARARESGGSAAAAAAALVAQCKLEEAEYAEELAYRRRELRAAKAEEAARVRAATADEVVQSSRRFALGRRRDTAEGTRQCVGLWKAERKANGLEHLKAASTRRADAAATRAHVKQLREKIVAERQAAAAAQRHAARQARAAAEARRNEAGSSLKIAHDEQYHAKFVPANAAKLVADADQAGLLA